MSREASRECQPRLGRSARRLVRRKSTRQEPRRDCTANGPYPGAFALYIGRGSPVPRGLGRVGSSSRLASPERGSMSPLLIRRGYPAWSDRSRSLLSVVEGPPTRRMLVTRLRLGEPFSILGVSVAAEGHPPQLRIQDPSVTDHELLETIGRLLAGGMVGFEPYSGLSTFEVWLAGRNRTDLRAEGCHLERNRYYPGLEVGPSGFEPESSGPEPPRIDQATPRTRRGLAVSLGRV